MAITKHRDQNGVSIPQKKTPTSTSCARAANERRVSTLPQSPNITTSTDVGFSIGGASVIVTTRATAERCAPAGRRLG